MSESLKKSLKSLAWLSQQVQKSPDQRSLVETKILFLGEGEKLTNRELKSIPPSIRKQIENKSSVEFWQNQRGDFWLIQPKGNPSGQSRGISHPLTKAGNHGGNNTGSITEAPTRPVKGKNHYGLFEASVYSTARDLAGTCFHQILKKGIPSLEVEYRGKNQDEFTGICVGLDLAQYRFRNCWPADRTPKMKIHFKNQFRNQKAVIKKACYLSEAVNLARFLTDCPANLLQPKTYAQLLKSQFGSLKNCKLQIWNGEKLKKEKMGLHLAVGQGSKDGSYMVHLNYNGGGKKSLAFVGKGITFDSGGLNLKSSPGIRLMKKDMGGSACLAGLASFVTRSQLPVNCDFYFAISENSLGSESFHPGDILVSRSHQTVEIDNTDAEGRLVLADVLTLAAEKRPSLLIDVATLTGAIKYGLGLSTAGLFSNDDSLAENLLESSQTMGEACWRMPLIPQEASRLKSNVADMVNCTDGFGGAVTAALFLEKFVGETSWAHFDIYSWTNRTTGPFATGGGTGQMVQTLSHFLGTQKQSSE